MAFDREQRVKAAWTLVYVISIAVLWYGNGALPLEFHDREMFADHERIERDPSFFFSPQKEQYNGRWFANAYQFAVYWLAGANSPTIYRLLALLLHGLVSVLLVRLALLRGCSRGVAHGAGLCFLVTPMHYQVLHHISAVDYILCALCGLWALAQAWQGRVWTVWMILALACSMLSHQSGVVFAAFCWVAVYQGRWRDGAPAAALVVGVGFVLRYTLPEQTSGGGAVTAFNALLGWSYVWEIVYSFISLLGRLVVFAFLFPLPPNSGSAVLAIVGGGVLVAMIGLIYRGHISRTWLIEAAVFCIPFSLLINEFLAGLTAGPIRYLYFSSAFVFVAMAVLLESLGKRWLGFGVGVGVSVALFSWAEARELTRASAAWAAADGYEEEALDLYLSLWESELLPEEYVEGAHENGLILAVGRSENFAALFTQAQRRYPENDRIRWVAESLEVLEEPEVFARYAPEWLADSQAKLVVGSVLYRLFRYHMRESKTEEMYAALVLAQMISPRAHMAHALKEVRKVLTTHDKLSVVHADFLKAYGLKSAP